METVTGGNSKNILHEESSPTLSNKKILNDIGKLSAIDRHHMDNSEDNIDSVSSDDQSFQSLQ